MNEADANNTLGILMDLASEDERLGLPSASNWRRYELCPGSHQLAQEARRLGQEAYQRPSAASARGDRIHAAEADQEVDLSESESVSAEFLRERADEQVARIFGDRPVREFKEQRLWLKFGERPVASGRFDRLIVSDEVALIQDFKSGWAEPDPAETNAQLKFLSVLVALEYSEVSEVVAQIISGPFGITEARYSIAQLSRAYEEVVSTLRALNEPHAGFHPSPEACKFCPAVNICQATKDLILPIARLQYSALPDGARAAQLLDECALLERHIESVKDYYREAFERDENYQIPGWGLEQGPPRRSVTDWHSARLRLEEYVDATELNGAESYKLASVEKALAKKLKLKGAPLKAKLAEILSGLLEEKYPTRSLKRFKDEPKMLSLAQE